MPAFDKDLDPCGICHTPNAETKAVTGDNLHQLCPRCGEFKASGTAMSLLARDLGDEKRAKLSGWVREQYSSGAIPRLTEEVLKQALARPLPTFVERAELLLLEAVRGQKEMGERFNLNEPRFLAASYSKNEKEVFFLQGLLKEQGMLQATTMGGGAEVMAQGYIHVDELTRKTTKGSQAFVAMWFSPDLDAAINEGFDPGILNAGYDPIMMNRVEHINRIDDEIIAQIKVSRFLVADFTGHRGGVYFEAGYAMGMGLPVIRTCRKDHMKGLHFDIRQFNCIDWETPADLADRLQKRIEAVIGVGPNKIMME